MYYPIDTMHKTEETLEDMLRIAYPHIIKITFLENSV